MSGHCWGSDASGQLGRAGATSLAALPAPVTVTGVAGAIDVAAGYAHTCAVLNGGSVMCWGYDSNGQLGNGTGDAGIVTPAQSATPLAVTGLTGARAITCGGHHTCAIVENSRAVCWGANDKGQLGAGIAPDAVPRPTPVRVAF